jgi:hypothetical protein
MPAEGQVRMIDPTLASALDNLIGLQIFIATYAADMRGFGFRLPRNSGNGDADEWYVHLQCCWRIESPERIITGSYDWYESAKVGADLEEDWKPTSGGSLQDLRLRGLFGIEAPERGPLYNQTNDLVVTDVQASGLGDLTLSLSGGYALRVIPAGSRGEQWRLFKRGDLDSHYICEAQTGSRGD